MPGISTRSISTLERGNEMSGNHRVSDQRLLQELACRRTWLALMMHGEVRMQAAPTDSVCVHERTPEAALAPAQR